MMKMKCIVLMITLAMVSSQAFAATLLNGGFEVPNVTDWTRIQEFSNNWDYAGDPSWVGLINENNAAHCPNLAAAEGDQFAFLFQNGAEIAQTVNDFVIGNDYPIVWSEAGRQITGGGSLWVLMDSTTICASHMVPGDETFRQTNVTFTATATMHRLRFFHPNDGGNREIFIDNVQILPEPATLGLLALFGLAFLRRK